MGDTRNVGILSRWACECVTVRCLCPGGDTLAATSIARQVHSGSARAKDKACEGPQLPEGRTSGEPEHIWRAGAVAG